MKSTHKNHILLIEYIKTNQNNFYKTAYMYTRSKDDALDVVQDAVLKALKASGAIKESRYIGTWFYRILINTSLTFIKRRKVTYPLEFVEDKLVSKEVQTADQIDLHNALGKLDDLEKSIIILRFFEDLKFKDVAEILGLNINTVKTKTYVILDKLKLQLECEVYDAE